MKRTNSFALLLSALTFVSLSSLYLLRETHLETFISLFTICYLFSLGMTQPKNRWLEAGGVGLFLVFGYFTAMKIIPILFG